jgi:hypothetical protein
MKIGTENAMDELLGLGAIAGMIPVFLEILAALFSEKSSRGLWKGC